MTKKQKHDLDKIILYLQVAVVVLICCIDWDATLSRLGF